MERKKEQQTFEVAVVEQAARAAAEERHAEAQEACRVARVARDEAEAVYARERASREAAEAQVAGSWTPP